MTDLSETSARLSNPSIQQPEDSIPSLSTPQRRRKTSDDRITDITSNSSRRRLGSRKETTHGASSRGDILTMQRSTSPTQMSPDSSVHYTRTGRISKAKKGLKVHHCECGRSYTRAEHLRRHQRNHAQDALRCDFPGCGKPFYRLDLLQRHQERHNEPGDGESPQIFSPASTAEPEPRVTASAALPPPIVTALPQSEPYYPQPGSPMPVSAADASSHVKRANFSSHPTSGSVPVPVEGLQTGIAWSDPFSYSPNHYSSSSEYASPIPSVPDYSTNMFANPPYGTRTRTSSNASHFEPAWAYPSQSPTSATSTMAYTWNGNEKSTAPSSLAYMATSYPMTSMPMSAGIDPMTGFGHFGPKTMVQRDEEEHAFLFPEQSYGMGQLAQTYPFEQYLNNFWRYFHPTHPIIHRATYESINQPPMLHAAMIAIGGQYSNDASVKRRSRILHDRCMKLLDKRQLDTGMTEEDRVCDWQALYLVEVLSQYRARRAAKTLSPRFETLYQKLADSFQEVTSNIADKISALIHPENATYERWAQWIELSTQQRLLLCCYILEYQQATLLARNPQPSLISYSGFDLPVPAHSELWDAPTPADWAMAAQQNPQPVTYVFQMSVEMIQTFDAFQSSLIIAAYYNHFSNPVPYLAPITFPAIDHLLDNSSITKHQLLTAKLLQTVPIRALLAISGESWIHSEKVPSPQIYANYKTTLRTWINGLWAPVPECQPVKEALKLAIEITRHAIAAPTHALRLELGPDMGLYYAALTIWAATVAANTRINTPQPMQPHRYQSHSPLPTSLPNYPSTPTHFSMNSTPGSTPNTSHSAALGLTSHPASSPVPSSPSTTSMQFSELTMLSANFLSTAQLELELLGVVPQWPRDMAPWRQGCAALIRWVNMRLKDGSTEGRDSVVALTLNVGVPGAGRGGDGFGELLDGVISHLDKLGSRGWEGWGF